MENSLLEFSDSLPPLPEQKPNDVYEVSGSDTAGNRTSNSETRAEMQESFAQSTANTAMVDGKIAEETARTDEKLEDKANKIHKPIIKTLDQLAAGDVPGLIIFDTGATPPAPAQAGAIEFDDGSRFDLTAGGDWTYADADGTVTDIYIGGDWKTTLINTGTAAVAAITDADDGAWKYGEWQSGETILDLEDLFDRGNSTQEELDNLVEAVGEIDSETVKMSSFTTGEVMTSIDVEHRNPNKATIWTSPDKVNGDGETEYTKDSTSGSGLMPANVYVLYRRKQHENTKIPEIPPK